MSRRRGSSSNQQQAIQGLHLLILLNTLVHFLRNDYFHPYLNLERTYRIYDGTLYSMLLSMFYHVEPTHLVVNMLALHRYGSELFVNTSSKKWQSFGRVVLSYVVCGIGAFLGIELLSMYHEYQWNQKLNHARYAHRCRHWLCESLNEIWGRNISSEFTNAGGAERARLRV